MNTKEEVLKQISIIQNTIINEKPFSPCSKISIIAWGIISMILFIFTPIIKQSTYIIFFILFFLTIGFLIEYILLKKVNAKFDFIGLTSKQKQIELRMIFMFLFATIFTLILEQNSLQWAIFAVWSFFLGINNLEIFATTKVNSLKIHGYFMLISSFFILISSIIGVDLSKYIFQISLINAFIVGGGYIIIGLKCNTKENNV